MRRVLAALGWLLLVGLLGCPKTDQSLVLIRGQTVDAADIDTAPLDILPRGALLVGRLDADTLFQTPLGGQVAQIVGGLLPLGAESGLVVARDVKRVFAAVYAMQGADFAAVVQGQFDVPAIEWAAQARARTPSGAPLVLTEYGGYRIYTVANIGFVALTPHTILSGNETGMRRALDRLRFGDPAGSLPAWMLELLEPGQQGQAGRAAFALVGDVTGEGVVAAASDRLPFLAGLRLVRLLGNFQPPGVNVVGSLSYQDQASAAQGASTIGQLSQLAYLASLLSSWGLGGRTPKLEVRQQGADVAFASDLDTSTAGLLLAVAAQVITPPR